MENKLTASELRTGNLIQTDYEGTMEVVNINSERLEYIDAKKPNYRAIGRFELAFVKPIPLTEEWLLKFGFEKVSRTWRFILPVGICELGIRYSSANPSYYSAFINEQFMTREIQYVHQLQNLFFAITNEELIIK